MANTFYDKGKEKILSTIDLLADDMRLVLVDGADYTPNFSTDEFLSDIAAGGRVATSPALTSKTVTAGAFDAADTSFTSVSGDQSEYLVLYQHTGTDSTAALILLWDTATGLPITPDGNNINTTFNASGLFSI